LFKDNIKETGDLIDVIGKDFFRRLASNVVIKM